MVEWRRHVMPLLMYWVYLSTTISHQITSFTWWRHQMETFPRYWPFVRGIHRSPVKSPHKGQSRGALMGFFICGWSHGWVNNELQFPQLREWTNDCVSSRAYILHVCSLRNYLGNNIFYTSYMSNFGTLIGNGWWTIRRIWHRTGATRILNPSPLALFSKRCDPSQGRQHSYYKTHWSWQKCVKK